MKILGIESSHDDTSIALVDDFQVIEYLKISQTDIHKQYGGTVPEIASREHYQNFYILLDQLKSKVDLNQIDKIAYTEKPGLIGALQMGKIFVHALSKSLNKPLIPINHLYGHIFSVLLDSKNKIKYPAIALVVSGGHTNLYLLISEKEFELLGQTLDDAAGEVFDKVSRVLFNVFPGGPHIDQIYHLQNDYDFNKYKLSSPKLNSEFDFSFSGYKTQIVNLVHNNANIDKNILAAIFQKTIIDYIISRVSNAIIQYQPQSIILSGGVSANQYLRQKFSKLHKHVLMPEIKYATDNGAMIAAAAYFKDEIK